MVGISQRSASKSSTVRLPSDPRNSALEDRKPIAHLAPLSAAESIVRPTVAHVANGELATQVARGLRSDPRRLSPLLWHDGPSALLTAQRARCEEYYLLRSEWHTLSQHSRSLSRFRPRVGGCHLIDLGTGEGVLTEKLVETLHPDVVTAVDSSDELLQATLRRLAPHRVTTHHFRTPSPIEVAIPQQAPTRMVHLPLELVGSLPRHQARQVMIRLGSLIGPDGLLVIGFDRTRDPETVLRAFNDGNGHHHALLRHAFDRMRDEFLWPIDGDDFDSVIRYDRPLHRIELVIRCRRPLAFSTSAGTVVLSHGSEITCGHHHLYRLRDVCAMACAAKLRIERVFADSNHHCCLAVLRRRSPASQEDDLISTA